MSRISPSRISRMIPIIFNISNRTAIILLLPPGAHPDNCAQKRSCVPVYFIHNRHRHFQRLIITPGKSGNLKVFLFDTLSAKFGSR